MSESTDIRRALFDALEEVVGEGLLDEHMSPETSICYDLELESIELIALLELLGERFGVVPDVFNADGGLDADKLDRFTFGALLKQLQAA